LDSNHYWAAEEEEMFLKKKYYPNKSAKHNSVGHGDFFFKTGGLTFV
jgi:hypothetical protein